LEKNNNEPAFGKLWHGRQKQIVAKFVFLRISLVGCSNEESTNFTDFQSLKKIPQQNEFGGGL